MLQAVDKPEASEIEEEVPAQEVGELVGSVPKNPVPTQVTHPYLRLLAMPMCLIQTHVLKKGSGEHLFDHHSWCCDIAVCIPDVEQIVDKQQQSVCPFKLELAKAPHTL